MFHDEHLIKVESVFHPVLSNLEEVVHLEARGGQHQSEYVEEPGEFEKVEIQQFGVWRNLGNLKTLKFSILGPGANTFFSCDQRAHILAREK